MYIYIYIYIYICLTEHAVGVVFERSVLGLAQTVFSSFRVLFILAREISILSKLTILFRYEATSPPDIANRKGESN